MANERNKPTPRPVPPSDPIEEPGGALQAELFDFPDAGGLSSDPAEDTQLPVPPPAAAPVEEVLPAPMVPAAPGWGSELPPPSLSDFRIIRKVGEGAMGAVYKAYQISAGRKVAVKVVFPHLARNPKILERFYREARTMGLLDHPGMVQAFAVGEEGGCHYIAMEYVYGNSLFKWLLRLGRLPVGDAVHITLACARALDHAHEQGLVHRDIKPENILITRSGEVKLTDFGMVKIDSDEVSLTQTGHAVGTPTYMPLEQARNSKDSDGRSDIYALGCTLYCMLTGQPPFRGPTLVELIRAKEMATFPPARRLNPNVPERLDLIILKMTAKSLTARYQTCAELVRDLEALRITSEWLSFVPAGRAVMNPEEDSASGDQLVESPAQAPARESVGDLWYLRFRDSAGQVVTQRIAQEEILRLSAKPAFDLSAKVSRDADDGFQFLVSHREFRQQLLSRLTKAGADGRTTHYRATYRKLAKADLARRRAQRNPEPTTADRLVPLRTPLLWLVGLAAAAGLGYLVYHNIVPGFVSAFLR